MELKIENLTKQYGNKVAIQNVSCTLKPGVVGLLGANGAGKSTLMRMICGVMKPTSGTVKLGKYDATDMGYGTCFLDDCFNDIYSDFWMFL